MATGPVGAITHFAIDWRNHQAASLRLGNPFGRGIGHFSALTGSTFAGAHRAAAPQFPQSRRNQDSICGRHRIR
jgi:hypothetical protein